MKISHEAYGKKITIETDYDDVTIETIYELIQKLLLGAGYSPSNIKEYFEDI